MLDVLTCVFGFDTRTRRTRNSPIALRQLPWSDPKWLRVLPLPHVLLCVAMAATLAPSDSMFHIPLCTYLVEYPGTA